MMFLCLIKFYEARGSQNRSSESGRGHKQTRVASAGLRKVSGGKGSAAPLSPEALGWRNQDQ